MPFFLKLFGKMVTAASMPPKKIMLQGVMSNGGKGKIGNF
jgi:hypothetical protein